MGGCPGIVCVADPVVTLSQQFSSTTGGPGGKHEDAALVVVAICARTGLATRCRAGCRRSGDMDDEEADELTLSVDGG